MWRRQILLGGLTLMLLGVSGAASARRRAARPGSKTARICEMRPRWVISGATYVRKAVKVCM